MTGIFSAAFYNSKIGFITGGDYEIPLQNFDNKAITTNGGKTWKLVGQNMGPGYVSCAQFIPNTAGKGIVTVGATGIYYSWNRGISWKQLHADSKLFTIRFLDEKTAIAAGKDKMIKIQFK
jgi:hypothetical protein